MSSAPSLTAANTSVATARRLWGLSRHDEAVAALRDEVLRQPSPLASAMLAEYLVLMTRYGDVQQLAGTVRDAGRTDCLLAMQQSVNRAGIYLLLQQWVERHDKSGVGDGVVLVFGCSGRSGTTLLQRALNSGGSVVVYGEDTYLGRGLPLLIRDFFGSHVTLGGLINADREKLRAGDDFWSARLMPDIPGYCDVILGSFFETARFIAEDAFRLRGTRRWGIKQPEPGAMRMLASLMPRARIVFIYRGLMDVAMSYKGRGWLASPMDCTALGESWRTNLEDALPIKAGNVLHVRYETLLANQAAERRRIEEFCDVPLDPGVMSRKLNNFKAYATPQALSEAECALLRTSAGEMLTDLYPEDHR